MFEVDRAIKRERRSGRGEGKEEERWRLEEPSGEEARRRPHPVNIFR